MSELLREKVHNHRTCSSRARLVSDDSFFGHHCNLGNSSSLLGALADIPDKSFDDDVEADKGASDFKDKGAIDGIEESKEPAA